MGNNEKQKARMDFNFTLGIYINISQKIKNGEV